MSENAAGMVLGCQATEKLTEAEVRMLEALADGVHAVDTEPFECEFEAHGGEVNHARLVQNQFSEEGEISWWLRWNSAGVREIKVEASCSKGDEPDAPCLLVVDHPGRCADGLSEEDEE